MTSLILLHRLEERSFGGEFGNGMAHSRPAAISARKEHLRSINTMKLLSGGCTLITAQLNSWVNDTTQIISVVITPP